MKVYDIIVSRRLGLRIVNHVAFWLLAYIFYLWIAQSIYLDNGKPPEEVTVLDHDTNLHLRLLPEIAVGILTYFAGTLIPYTYVMAYWVVPPFSKRRYRSFVIRLVLVSLLLEVTFLDDLGILWSVSGDFSVDFVSHLSLFMNGPPIVFGFFITIKTLKTWYLREEQRIALQRENAEAELQLLKSQIHPHFLFNALNNIYSFALDRSPQAGELVLKLKGLLHYMINECQGQLVPIEKEIKMIEDYISLEKVRYGNNLVLHVRIQDQSNDALIAPLLLIPFLENSFKHGTSEMLKSPWIRLELLANTDALHFSLINSKPKMSGHSKKPGIGLKNARKRLQLLYQDHQIKIADEQDQFTVILKVPLKPTTTNETRPDRASEEYFKPA